MKERREHDRSGGFELQNFERNRYFQGKLMTARDMQAEQQYHLDLTRTLTRLTTGTGIVSGLIVSDFQDQGDAFRITVEPGVAIDDKGRPLVVKNATTKLLPKPEGDELYLHLKYEKRHKDHVPVPGAEPMSDEKTEESRILEVTELLYRETPPPELASVPEIEFPEFARRSDVNPADLAAAVAESYHEIHRATLEADSEPTIFLGSFKKTPDGDWQPGSETKRRPMVYDNEMLFDLFISHVADTDNPHRTTVAEPTDYVESELDRIEGFAMRLEALTAELSTLQDDVDRHTAYATRKSLKTTVRLFDRVDDRFDAGPDASKLVVGIIDLARQGIREDIHTDADAYFGVCRRIHDRAAELLEHLESEVTTPTAGSYRSALADLESAIEDESLLDTAISLDKLAESADSLQRRYGVVPEASD